MTFQKRLSVLASTAAMLVAAAFGGSAQAQTNATFDYIACLPEDFSRQPAYPNYTLYAAYQIGLESATLWRLQCRDNPSRYAVIIALAARSGQAAVQIAGHQIMGFQNGRSIGPFILKQGTRDAQGFNGWLVGTGVFILANGPASTAPLDESKPFELYLMASGSRASFIVPEPIVASGNAIEYKLSAGGRDYFHLATTPQEKQFIRLWGEGWSETGNSFSVSPSAPGQSIPLKRYVDLQTKEQRFELAIVTDAKPKAKAASLEDQGEIMRVVLTQNASCAEGSRELFVMSGTTGDRITTDKALAQTWTAQGFAPKFLGNRVCVQ